MEEIIFASATSLALAIREGQVSSQQVVDAYLNRIAAINPALNAVVQAPTPAGAFACPRTSAAWRASNQPGGASH